MSKSLIDHSKTTWTVPDEKKYPVDENIKIGCLQRIASATELMAKNYQSLIDERDRFKRYYNDEANDNKALRKRVASLRGVITKLKKK